MAKESGIGLATTIASNNISNDVMSCTLDTPRNLQDVSGLDVSSIERLALLADGTVTLNGNFNDAASMSHATLKDTPTNTTVKASTFVISGQTLTMSLLFSSYALNRGADGSLTFTANGQLAATTSFGWS